MFGELCWQLYPSLDYPTVCHIPCLCWLQALGLLPGTEVNLRAIIQKHGCKAVVPLQLSSFNQHTKVVQKVKTVRAWHSRRSTAAYPAYSPDLVSSDFQLFPTLKEFLGSRHFESDEEESKDSVKEWLNVLAAEVCDEGIQELITRYDRCLNGGGYCVEKYLRVCNNCMLNLFLFGVCFFITEWSVLCG